MHSYIGNDLEADSLDMINVVISLEEEWNIDLSNSDLSIIETVNDLVEHIHVKIEEGV